MLETVAVEGNETHLRSFLSLLFFLVANAATGLAVDTSRDNTIVNGNLYYFVSANTYFLHDSVCAHFSPSIRQTRLIFCRCCAVKPCFFSYVSPHFLVRAGRVSSLPLSCWFRTFVTYLG